MAYAKSLTRFAWLSIAAALATILLKAGAYLVTGSVGMLSDALESMVNLVAAVVALLALAAAARPADADHQYGHQKIEYFSSGFEGALILVAAGGIVLASFERLSHPQPINDIGLGIVISIIASAVNLAVSRVLLSASRLHHSIALEADSRHLMTDVWTSAAVVVGVSVAAFSGTAWLDPIIAMAVAVQIIWSALSLLRRSALGLLDTALPAEDRANVERALDAYREQGVFTHALRTRGAGARNFVSFHVLVPGQWSVQQAHNLLEQMEGDVRALLPNVTVFTHLEPIEDPASFADQFLDRSELPPQPRLRQPSAAKASVTEPSQKR
jgi:cation diffusion facilitator family transporter